jgi:putative ABC transport system permease protein
MTLQEAAAAALSSLATHKMRASLATLGVVFGVAAVIAMLSIGAGAEREALTLLEQLGTQNIIVRARDLTDDELVEIRERSPGLSVRDQDAIMDAVPGVELIAPRARIRVWRIAAGLATSEAMVLGVDQHHPLLVRVDLAEGRFLDGIDILEHAQVCVIGDGVRRELFGYEAALGEMLKVNDVWLEVVGVLAPDSAAAAGTSETPAAGVSMDSPARAIYIPVTTALRKFDQRPLDSPLHELVVHLAEGGGARASRTAAVAVQALLDQLHGGASDFELIVPEQLIEQSRRTQRLFNLVMGAIAGISLLVGGIGIMNIMLATVLERTREIGIRRAVGAKRRDILVQFLMEAFSISAFGAATGVVAGIAIARVIAALAGWPTIVTLLAVSLAVGVALAGGRLAGFSPARRAAMADPVVSLRYEEPRACEQHRRDPEWRRCTVARTARCGAALSAG